MEATMADPPIRVLEFYSGIGGLRYSLEESGVKAAVVEAFDINDVANDVYEYNFGHRPSQGNIQGLSVQQLDKYMADAWLLSPPCQPYTRQGLQKDADDARATSFLKMLQLLPLMTSPPTHLLVENVVGFENSVTHNRLLATLENAGFVTQEFILSPLQFGIPYSRPRYFCLAKRNPENFVQPDYNGQLLCNPGPLLHLMGMNLTPVVIGEKNAKTGIDISGACIENILSNGAGQILSTEPRRNEPLLDPAVQCKPVKYYLETNPDSNEAMVDQNIRPACREEIQHFSFSQPVSLDIDPGGPTEEMSESDHGENIRQSTGFSDENHWEPYKVPLNVVQRWIDAYDIVTPDSRRCCCFTKSYTRYAKGTGSFLATKVPLEEGGSTVENYILDLRLQGQCLSTLGLRYFTPREVANFHSFPPQFRFPAHVRLKQRYALLGNSLSVAVVSCIIKYLFSASTYSQP